MSWLDVVARVMERVVPDAVTTAIMLMVVVFVLALGVGGSVASTFDAYYRGLWSLLAFTMQMTLILVLSLVLGATPFFKRSIVAVSRLPTTRVQVVSLAVLCDACVGVPELGPCDRVVADHRDPLRARRPRKGHAHRLPVPPGILAGAGAIWQFGFSGSAPLLMATPGALPRRRDRRHAAQHHALGAGDHRAGHRVSWSSAMFVGCRVDAEEVRPPVRASWRQSAAVEPIRLAGTARPDLAQRLETSRSCCCR